MHLSSRGLGRGKPEKGCGVRWRYWTEEVVLPWPSSATFLLLLLLLLLLLAAAAGCYRKNVRVPYRYTLKARNTRKTELPIHTPQKVFILFIHRFAQKR